MPADAPLPAASCGAPPPAQSPGDPPGAAAPEEQRVRPKLQRSSAREAGILAIGVTAATAGAVAFTFDPARAGAMWLLAPIGVFYATLGAFTAFWLHRRGELRAALRPVYGDLTVGALLAAVLYFASMGAALIVASHDSPRAAWLGILYQQLGDPEADSRLLVGGVVFGIAALEEIVWRGLVMRALEGPLGPSRAWVLSSTLYATAHLPAMILLAAPIAGPNPVLVAAAFGCGLVWGRVVHRTGRLVPAVFAHALFSWALLCYPLWHR